MRGSCSSNNTGGFTVLILRIQVAYLFFFVFSFLLLENFRHVKPESLSYLFSSSSASLRHRNAAQDSTQTLTHFTRDAVSASTHVTMQTPPAISHPVMKEVAFQQRTNHNIRKINISEKMYIYIIPNVLENICCNSSNITNKKYSRTLNGKNQMH